MCKILYSKCKDCFHTILGKVVKNNYEHNHDVKGGQTEVKIREAAIMSNDC